MCEAVEEDVGLSFNDLQVGQSFSWKKVFTRKGAQELCKVIGDHNRIHFDDEFARSRRHKGAIVHGHWLLGEISRACGDTYFEQGVCVFNLQSSFSEGVLYEKDYTYLIKVNRLFPRLKIVILGFSLTSPEGEKCLEGEVRLRFP